MVLFHFYILDKQRKTNSNDKPNQMKSENHFNQNVYLLEFGLGNNNIEKIKCHKIIKQKSDQFLKITHTSQ